MGRHRIGLWLALSIRLRVAPKCGLAPRNLLWRMHVGMKIATEAIIPPSEGTSASFTPQRNAVSCRSQPCKGNQKAKGDARASILRSTQRARVHRTIKVGGAESWNDERASHHLIRPFSCSNRVAGLPNLSTIVCCLA